MNGKSLVTVVNLPEWVNLARSYVLAPKLRQLKMKMNALYAGERLLLSM